MKMEIGEDCLKVSIEDNVDYIWDFTFQRWFKRDFRQGPVVVTYIRCRELPYEIIKELNMDLIKLLYT